MVVERTEAEGGIQDNVLRRIVCLGGKNLLHRIHGVARPR